MAYDLSNGQQRAATDKPSVAATIPSVGIPARLEYVDLRLNNDPLPMDVFPKSPAKAAVRVIAIIGAPLLAIWLAATIIAIQPLKVHNVSKHRASVLIMAGPKEVFRGELAPDDQTTMRFLVNDDWTYAVAATFDDGTSLRADIGYMTPLDTFDHLLEIGHDKVMWNRMWVSENQVLRRAAPDETLGEDTSTAPEAL